MVLKHSTWRPDNTSLLQTISDLYCNTIWGQCLKKEWTWTNKVMFSWILSQKTDHYSTAFTAIWWVFYSLKKDQIVQKKLLQNKKGWTKCWCEWMKQYKELLKNNLCNILIISFSSQNVWVQWDALLQSTKRELYSLL